MSFRVRQYLGQVDVYLRKLSFMLLVSRTYLVSIAILSFAAACNNQVQLPGSTTKIQGSAQTWRVKFSYTHSLAGKVVGIPISVEQNDSQKFEGEMLCSDASTLQEKGKFECSGAGAAEYSSFGSCTDWHGTSSHSEVAEPWKGVVRGTLNVNATAGLWSVTIEAPVMHVHIVEIRVDDKRSEQDSNDQFITDLDVEDAKLDLAAMSGAHHETGNTTEELAFGSCETGAGAAVEKADLKVDIAR